MLKKKKVKEKDIINKKRKKRKEKGNSFNYILFVKADLTNNVSYLQYFHAFT